MRFFTTAAAVVVVAAILCTAVAIYIDSADNRRMAKELEEKYDIDGYWEERGENGLSTFHPGRLWPGSIDSDAGSPVADDGAGSCPEQPSKPVMPLFREY